MKKQSLSIGITFLVLAFLMLVSSCYGQRQNSLEMRCPGVSPVVPYAKVEVQKTGNINIVPCATKNFLFNGSPISITGLSNLNGLSGASQTFAVSAADTAAISSAATTHTLNLPITTISGSSRTNYFPIFDGSNSLGKSAFSFDSANNTYLMNKADTYIISNSENAFQIIANGSGQIFTVTNNSDASMTFDASSRLFSVAANTYINGELGLNSWTPANATAACTTGRIGADANYIYYCISNGNIKRTPISTW